MSKRNSATKRARSPRATTQAHRNKQHIVRGAKVNLPRSVAVGPIEPLRETHDFAKQPASVVEEKGAAVVDNGVDAAQDNLNQQMRYNKSHKGQGFPLVPAHMVAYQAKLLELAIANMQFTFEFTLRVASALLRVTRGY